MSEERLPCVVGQAAVLESKGNHPGLRAYHKELERPKRPSEGDIFKNKNQYEKYENAIRDILVECLKQKEPEALTKTERAILSKGGSAESNIGSKQQTAKGRKKTVARKKKKPKKSIIGKQHVQDASPTVQQEINAANIPKPPENAKPAAYYPRRRRTLTEVEHKFDLELATWLEAPRERSVACDIVRNGNKSKPYDYDMEPDDSDEEFDSDKDYTETEILNHRTRTNHHLNILNDSRPDKKLFHDICQYSKLKRDDKNAHEDIHDQHGRSLANYVNSSLSVGIYPEPLAVFRSSTDRENGIVNLGNHGLGDLKLGKAAAQAFSTLPIVQGIFSGNRLSDKGAAALISCLNFKRGSGRIRLDFSNNKLGVLASESLAKRIRLPKNNITDVNLSGNLLDASALSVLCAPLYGKHSIRHLDLSRNALGVPGASVLAEFLETDTCLEHLSLGWTKLSARGASLIVKALAGNTLNSLVSLDLSNNAIGRLSLGFDQPSHTAAQNDEFNSRRFEAEFAGTLSGWLMNSNTTETMDSYKLGACNTAEANATRGQEHSCNLVHLNLSHNQLDKETATLIAQALEANKVLLGLHFEGNNGWVDAIGFLHSGARGSIDDHAEQAKTNGSDPNTRFKELITHLEPCDPTFRHRQITNAWAPPMSCWICSGWSQQRITICAKSDSCVMLHTNFDSPAWSGTPMTRSDYVHDIGPTGTNDEYVATKMRAVYKQTQTFGTQCKFRGGAVSYFEYVEFSVVRVCPPGEICFFFTIDGKPTLSDSHLSRNWSRARARQYVVEPPGPIEGTLQVNIARVVPRQQVFQQLSDSMDDEGNDEHHGNGIGNRQPMDSGEYLLASAYNLSNAAAWQLRKESGLYGYEELENAKITAAQANQEKSFYDLMQIVRPISGTLFCTGSPPRDRVLVAQQLDLPRGEPSTIEGGIVNPHVAQFEVKYIKQALEHDWEIMEISDIVARTEEFASIKNALEKYFYELVVIFQYYSFVNIDTTIVQGDDPAACSEMTQGEFVKLCYETDLSTLAGKKLDSIEDLYKQALSAQQKRDVTLKASIPLKQTRRGKAVDKLSQRSVANAITRASFAEILVRMGVGMSVGDDGTPIDKGWAVGRLLENFTQRTRYFDIHALLSNMVSKKPVEEILSKNVTPLLHVYTAHSGRYCQNSETAWMSQQEWIGLLESVGFMNEQQTESESESKAPRYLDKMTATLIFVSSSTIRKEGSRLNCAHKMSFPEFLVAVSILSTFLLEIDDDVFGMFFVNHNTREKQNFKSKEITNETRRAIRLILRAFTSTDLD